MNRADATMAIKFTVLALHALVILLGTMGIGRLHLFLVRVEPRDDRSH